MVIPQLDERMTVSNPILQDEMFEWAKDLFPICRSITGEGVRETLSYLKNILPKMSIHEVPTGTRAFDWTVPEEWNIEDAYIIDPNGKKIVDFKKNNLHVIGYSEPVDKILELGELKQNLYSDPNRPESIPYITSYYQKRWGFCLAHSQLEGLEEGKYEVVIRSSFKQGSLTYGELLIPGKSDKEIFLSTYICHPSMANNEISGPVVTAAIGRTIMEDVSRRYSYRIIFIPETIGSIVYLSRNLVEMKKKVVAGFNVSCMGDDLSYTYIASRNGGSLSDKVATHVLRHIDPNYVHYSFLKRGSDERQYCSPGVDLPVVSVMRTRYGDYPEYHSSDDNLDFISPSGLGGGYEALYQTIKAVEFNRHYVNTILCEPQLSRRELTTSLGYGGDSIDEGRYILSNLLAYCDGERDLVDIAEMLDLPIWKITKQVDLLLQNGLIKPC